MSVLLVEDTITNDTISNVGVIGTTQLVDCVAKGDKKKHCNVSAEALELPAEASLV